MSSASQTVEVLRIRLVLRGVNPRSFHIRGRDYGLYRDGGIWFEDDATQVPLRQLGLRAGERFVYEYDMGDMSVHELRLERTIPPDARTFYPQCIGGKRSGPPEDCGDTVRNLQRYLSPEAEHVLDWFVRHDAADRPAPNRQGAAAGAPCL